VHAGSVPAALRCARDLPAERFRPPPPPQDGVEAENEERTREDDHIDHATPGPGGALYPLVRPVNRWIEVLGQNPDCGSTGNIDLAYLVGGDPISGEVADRQPQQEEGQDDEEQQKVDTSSPVHALRLYGIALRGFGIISAASEPADDVLPHQVGRAGAAEECRATSLDHSRFGVASGALERQPLLHFLPSHRLSPVLSEEVSDKAGPIRGSSLGPDSEENMEPAHEQWGRYPLFDPLWLRRLHSTCLWDGGVRLRNSEFCSLRCEERYVEWEESMVSHYVGREPLETFLQLEA
jgi:hypothetical protein